jgi:arsenate reductase-like glutaredoxin family protein
MENISINKNKLTEAINIIKKSKSKDSFNEDILEREERIRFFQEIIEGEINEYTFGQLIKKLWAMRIWGNKDYVIDKMIQENGIEKLEKTLKYVYKSDEDEGKLYKKLNKDVKYMGPSMASELLCHLHPKKAGIWNNQSRKALGWLEVNNIPYNKYSISAEEYNRFNKSLKYLAEIFEKEGFEDIDLLSVDYLLWEIANSDKVKDSDTLNQKQPLVVGNKTRHEELKEKVAQIGSWLGFDYDLEVKISDGAIVDVIWTARISNLGKVSYAFEVQSKGSIDSLILNLQKSLNNSSIQKLVIATDAEQIEKIKKEVHNLPENFRNALVYWDSNNIDKTHSNLELVNQEILKLDLVPESL